MSFFKAIVKSHPCSSLAAVLLSSTLPFLLQYVSYHVPFLVKPSSSSLSSRRGRPQTNILYGLDVSYYTGKTKAFLQYMDVPFKFEVMTLRLHHLVFYMTGMNQMPALQTSDGSFLTDSSAIVRHYLTEAGERRVGAVGFLERLMEDYADEWLWRPAMHYRWSFPKDASLRAHSLATTTLRDMLLPLCVRRWIMKNRQYIKYVPGDGVTAANREHVEDIYARVLACLSGVLESRKFLLGDKPSPVDFAFFASFGNHFGLDPTPKEIMQRTAPDVFDWVTRMWSVKRVDFGGIDLPDAIPSDLDPIFRDIGACYLPYLVENALAFQSGRAHFEMTLEGYSYRFPTNMYRVWCLEQLQSEFDGLSGEERRVATKRMRAGGCWRDEVWGRGEEEKSGRLAVRSGFDPLGKLPFLTPETAWTDAVRKKGSKFSSLAQHNGLARG
jgi:glutathione S-transferase